MAVPQVCIEGMDRREDVSRHITVGRGDVSSSLGLKDGSDADSKLGDPLSIGPEYAGYIGLASIAVFTICWIIGAWVDEDWVLFEDNLCILGISDVMFVRVLYPIGCTLTGIGLMLFGYSVSRFCDHVLQRCGYLSCIPFGISLIGIGSITLDFSHDLHMVFVYIMGAAAGLVLVLITVDDIIHRKWIISLFVIFMSLGFAYFNLFDTDYIQPFTITCLFIWLGVKCIHLIRTGCAY